MKQNIDFPKRFLWNEFPLVTGTNEGYILQLHCTHENTVPIVTVDTIEIGWICKRCYYYEIDPIWILYGI